MLFRSLEGGADHLPQEPPVQRRRARDPDRPRPGDWKCEGGHWVFAKLHRCQAPGCGAPIQGQVAREPLLEGQTWCQNPACSIVVHSRRTHCPECGTHAGFHRVLPGGGFLRLDGPGRPPRAQQGHTGQGPEPGAEEHDRATVLRDGATVVSWVRALLHPAGPMLTVPAGYPKPALVTNHAEGRDSAGEGWHLPWLTSHWMAGQWGMQQEDLLRWLRRAAVMLRPPGNEAGKPSIMVPRFLFAKGGGSAIRVALFPSWIRLGIQANGEMPGGGCPVPGFEDLLPNGYGDQPVPYVQCPAAVLHWRPETDEDQRTAPAQQEQGLQPQQGPGQAVRDAAPGTALPGAPPLQPARGADREPQPGQGAPPAGGPNWRLPEVPEDGTLERRLFLESLEPEARMAAKYLHRGLCHSMPGFSATAKALAANHLLRFGRPAGRGEYGWHPAQAERGLPPPRDRKSTRLNSSHSSVSRMPSSA